MRPVTTLGRSALKALSRYPRSECHASRLSTRPLFQKVPIHPGSSSVFIDKSSNASQRHYNSRAEDTEEKASHDDTISGQIGAKVLDGIKTVIEVMIDEPVAASRRTRTGSCWSGGGDQVKGSESSEASDSDGSMVGETSSTQSQHLEPKSSSSDVTAAENIIGDGASAEDGSNLADCFPGPNDLPDISLPNPLDFVDV